MSIQTRQWASRATRTSPVVTDWQLPSSQRERWPSRQDRTRSARFRQETERDLRQLERQIDNLHDEYGRLVRQLRRQWPPKRWPLGDWFDPTVN